MLRSYEYGSNREYEFVYDMRGRLAAKKCTDGSRIIFGYDGKDYLRSSSVMLPGQKLGTMYHYGSGSSNQPYKSRVYGVTITDVTATKMLLNTSSASDSLNRLASRSINAVGGKSLVYGYTYERGTTLPLTLSATVGDVSSTLVYTYDAAGNITSVTDGENATRYCYDNMGQLIREDNPYSQKTCVYAYDNCGNILSRTEYGYTDDETPTGGTVTVYEYNNADWGDQLTSWNGESITYDAIGNPLLYRGRSLTWTQGRRLAGITAEGLNVTYTYDESGTRTGKTVNGVSTQYYINGSQILAQKSGEDILYFLYDETGAAVGFKYNNNLYLYRKNLQGDILAVLNGQTGAAEASYTYDAWGRVISATGALAEINPFRYRGYYYDSETGLYYLQSRYYDPETGRFINADGYINTDFSDTNSYSYCGNCPVGYVDFCGHCRMRFDGVKLKDCHSFSCPYSEGLAQKEFESMLIAGIAKKPNFTPRKDPSKGSENRQPSGARERNKAHPDSEEHSRVPKGNNTGRRKFNKNDDDIMKEFWDNARYTCRIQRMWRWPWEEEFERNTPTGDLTFWEIINPFRKR